MCEYVLEVEPNKLREFTIAINFILRILEGCIAGFSTAYMARLGKMSMTERKRAERAERELRHVILIGSCRKVGVAGTVGSAFCIADL